MENVFSKLDCFSNKLFCYFSFHNDDNVKFTIENILHHQIVKIHYNKTKLGWRWKAALNYLRLRPEFINTKIFRKEDFDFETPQGPPTLFRKLAISEDVFRTNIIPFK